MIICGIDENGLGPFVGPLVITAYEREVRSEPPAYSEPTTSQSESAIFPDDKTTIKDSKKIFSRNEKGFKLIEEIFINGVKPPKDIYSVFENSEMKEQIKRICPLSPDLFCFSRIPIPIWTKTEDGKQREGSEKAPEEETRDKRVVFAIICPRLLLLGVRRFGSKFSANSYFMSVLGIRSRARLVICGKSGSKKSYEKEIRAALSDLNVKAELKILRESNTESSYIIETESEEKEIRFVKNADSRFFEVARASIIGKYIREICMMSITRSIFPQSEFPISGYGQKQKLKHVPEKIIAKLKSTGYDLDADEIRECIERNY